MSPSQMAKALLCPRAWGFQYLLGRVPAPKASAELGSKVHASLEAWLKQGITPTHETKWGQIAQHAIRALPQPAACFVEARRTPVWLGVQWDLRKDLEFAEGLVVVVHDHKTTSSRTYAKTPQQLGHDVQAIIYAYEAFERTGAERVRCQWFYMLTNQRGCWYSAVEFDRSEISALAQPFLELGVLLSLLTKVDFRTLPRNIRSCSAYGGCPHIEECGVSAQDLFLASLGDNTMTTMTPDQLRQQMLAQLQGAPQGQPQQQQFAPQQQPQQAQPQQPQQFAPPQQAQQFAQPQQTQQPQQVQQFAPPQQQFAQPQQPQQAQQFVPPQQFAPPQGQPGAGPVVQPQQPLEALFQGQPSQPQAQQFAPPQPEAPAKPGRPAGTKKRKTLTLCLDCVVLRGTDEVVPLAAFVEPARALAAQQEGSEQAFASAVRAQLQTPLASDTTVYVDRSTPLARTLLDVLTSVADVVYVGV